MSGPDVDEANIGLPASEGELPEVGVVGQDHPALSVRVPKDVAIRNADEPKLAAALDASPFCPKGLDDLGVDVLVREERKIEGAHAGTLISQMTSLRRALAAYSKAASSPSPATCG